MIPHPAQADHACRGIFPKTTATQMADLCVMVSEQFDRISWEVIVDDCWLDFLVFERSILSVGPSCGLCFNHAQPPRGIAKNRNRTTY